MITGARPPDGGEPVDVAIRDGTLIEIGPALERSATTEIDAHGLRLLPGGIDPTSTATSREAAASTTSRPWTT